MKAFAEQFLIFIPPKGTSHFFPIDTTPLPASGQSAWWKCKAIYRPDAEWVGQRSDVVSLAVAG